MTAEEETLFFVVWRLNAYGPYALDVDGPDASALATKIAMNLAESGRETVTIIEHTSPIDSDIRAAVKARVAAIESASKLWREAAG